MKRLVLGMMIAVFAGAITLLPAASRGDPNQAAGASSPPPIGGVLVREGDFAVQLEAALGIGTAGNETEAESRLAETGISPRNGWIADYPVTPDISGEVYNAVRAAADVGKIRLSEESALERFNNVMAQAGLSATASSAGGGSGAYAGSASAPGEAAIDDYYYTEGPPVVTYYSPPPDYSYLYAWVPYPFWCYDFWFPGYFILNDFHRPVFMGGRGVFVSNHFHGIGGHRYARIDPVARFQGRPAMTTSGTGRSWLPPAGVSRGSRRGGVAVSASRLAPGRFSVPAFRGGGMHGAPYGGRGRGAFNAPSAAAPHTAASEQRSVYRSGWGGGRAMAHSGISGGSYRGGGMMSTGFHGGGSSGGRGHR
ncbi:MAG: hypothetical protein P4L44_07315 [Oryzomonas sp.]|uniref:hypothetical protein n=1 Tax=Oryzomonas sp. TaxID=2855186 RepID=UPI00283B6567|nr:hypothetical protein [Oryzomonas sp.]MDR3579752.1 hypothetical protein [Oryzomonas sp.]